MIKDIKTIGIVAHTGIVGSTVYRYFKEELKMPTYGYSLKKREEEEKVNKADLVFICVPTPFEWPNHGFKDHIVDEALSKLQDGMIVVIKSTVVIGTTEKFQKKYPKLFLMFNPEFLSEATNWEDFVRPDRQFVGYTKESYKYATQVLNLLPESPYDAIMPAKEAELLKYINNMHGILEIIESNHYYDVCQKEGLDYDRVIRAAVSSKWVGCSMGRHYRVIFHKGKRGFGGKCFPKDLNVWIQYCNNKGLDVRLLAAAREINRDLLVSQGLNEELAEKVTSAEKFKEITKKKK